MGQESSDRSIARADLAGVDQEIRTFATRADSRRHTGVVPMASGSALSVPDMHHTMTGNV